MTESGTTAMVPFEQLNSSEQSKLLDVYVIRRLLLSMDCQQMRVTIGSILSFIATVSKVRTTVIIDTMVEVVVGFGMDEHDLCMSNTLMHRVAVKSVMRTCIVLCGLLDDLMEWRVDRVMTSLVDTVHRSPGIVFVEGFAEMLPRICRLYPSAAAWWTLI